MSIVTSITWARVTVTYADKSPDDHFIDARVECGTSPFATRSDKSSVLSISQGDGHSIPEKHVTFARPALRQLTPWWAEFDAESVSGDCRVDPVSGKLKFGKTKRVKCTVICEFEDVKRHWLAIERADLNWVLSEAAKRPIQFDREYGRLSIRAGKNKFIAAPNSIVAVDGPVRRKRDKKRSK